MPGYDGYIVSLWGCRAAISRTKKGAKKILDDLADGECLDADDVDSALEIEPFIFEEVND